MTVKVHLDTDLGGDIDDLCALALLLRWPEGVQLTGVTTVGDTGGRRAGYVRYVLALEGRADVPVAAGADTAQGFYPYELGLPPEERYWPEAVAPYPTPPEEAIRLLKASIEQGAVMIGIGPYTNFYLLEQQYLGILREAKLFLMGGHVFPTRVGFPAWGSDMDFNIQVDVRSAGHVLRNSHPTLIPLSVTVETALRRSHLASLRGAGPLGRLIARQAEAFALDWQNETRFGKTCPGLPEDIINFQHDPLACAVALGWQDGVEIQELPLMVEERDGLLVEHVHPDGKTVRIVTQVEGPRFNEFWLETIIGS
jgi:inosine-uridine nucleoside N-ribohydrolase